MSQLTANWGFKSRGLMGALLGAAFGTAVVLSAPLAAEGTWRAIELSALGWVVFLAGAGMRFWSTLYIGGRKSQTVICDGPYSICRNPLYVGTFLVNLSGAIMLQSLTFCLGIILLAVFYARWTVPAEERFLAEKLGDEYLRYCRRVPRYWPKWSGFQSPATIPVSLHGLKLECKRAARWIWLPVLAQILTHLRSEDWWPHLLNLP